LIQTELINRVKW